MKKLMIIVIGLLLSFQILHANVEKTVVLNKGYNAVQFDANITFGELKEKIGVDNLLMIQGAGQGSTYKKKYVEDGLKFLNSFTQTEFGKAYWIKVTKAVTFTYMAENYVDTKVINLNAGWSFVGPPLPLTLTEIKSQLNKDRAGNLLVIQGAGQGSTYKKVYEENTPFLNSFTAFEVGKGYWIKVEKPASLTFIFDLDKIAKDNVSHNAEIVKTINGKNYTIRVYSDKEPTSETSQSSIAVYGTINGEIVSISINDSYTTDARFQVKVFDKNGDEVTKSNIVDYQSSSIEFSAITIFNNNPCITLANLKTKIANNEDVTQVNTECITDMSNLFKDNKTFNQDISQWDVSHVIDMSRTFDGAMKFNQPIGMWDVSNVTDMNHLFNIHGMDFNQDITKWNVSSVVDMSGMFHAEFNQPIGDWNVSNVTNMANMFGKGLVGCSFNQDISNWDVSNVTNMSEMFISTPFNQDISNWDVSSVTNMNGMFWFTFFNQDISKWKLSNITDMGVFAPRLSIENYSKLLIALANSTTLQNNTTLYVSDTKYSKEAEISRQHIIDTYGWSITDGGLDRTVQEVAQAKIESFADNSTNPKPTLQDYSDAGVVGVTVENLDAINRRVDNATKDEVDTIEELNTLVANLCITLTDLKIKIANNKDVTHLNTGCITDMSYLFKGNENFNQDIGDWDVSNVRDMTSMFYGAKAFNQDIGDWNVSKVTQMPIMFLEASSFNQDIGNWDVSSVIYIKSMFAETSFNQDISDWNVSNVTNMNFMFYNNKKFNQDISDWNVSNVKYMNFMFYNTLEFNQDLSNWDVSKVIDHTSFADGSLLQNEYNPFYEAITPDYNVSIELSQTHFTPGNTPVAIRIEVNELLGGINSGNLELFLSKNSHFNLTVENNSDWEVSSDDFDYKFKYIKENGVYTPKAISIIRLTGTFYLEEGSRGSFPMTINLRNGSGDINSDNNSDSKQVIYNTVQGTALAKIRAYANNNVNPTPTLQDYIDAGVEGVTLENLDAVNSAVNDAVKEDVDTLAELNALVQSVTVPEAGIEEKIVTRHNLYRKLDFQDSNLVWDKTLANHAQQWADYIATHYTVADRQAGSPHASHFDTSIHGLPYLGEGENIAWASANLKYARDEAVDITVENSSQENYEFGAVDMWANEKAYYDYASNSGNGEVVGHYTQVVWQKTTKVGCGKAKSTTDLGGDHIVCRYEIPGNMTGEKPYCSNYTVSDLYTETSSVFTNSIIEDASFVIEKVLEDRSACTRTDTGDSTLTFTGTTSAAIPQYNTFNTSDGSNLWNMNFDNIQIDAGGQLIMTNAANNRYMKLKIVGETADYYSVEGYWWVIGTQYERRAILKLMK